MTRTAHIRNPIEGVVYATEAATEGWLKSGACVKVSQFVQHEIIESIYFRDPNWYPLEITRSLRDVEEPDAVDATATIEAAIELEGSGKWKDIEQLWRNKVKFVRASQDKLPENVA